MTDIDFRQRWALFSIAILLASAGWIWVTKAPPGGASHGALPAPRPGFTAPDFELQTLAGEAVRLSDLRGQAVLVNLWATWCPPCRAEMPAIEAVYREYASQGFVVLGVDAANQDDLSQVEDFIQEYELTFPILLDLDGAVSRSYGLRSFPTSFFIDGDGTIREVVIGGPMAKALLEIRVQGLLEEGR